jgi:hypothetical protein
MIGSINFFNFTTSPPHVTLSNDIQCILSIKNYLKYMIRYCLLSSFSSKIAMENYFFLGRGLHRRKKTFFSAMIGGAPKNLPQSAQITCNYLQNTLGELVLVSCFRPIEFIFFLKFTFHHESYIFHHATHIFLHPSQVKNLKFFATIFCET